MCGCASLMGGGRDDVREAGRAEWVAVLGRENERRFRSLFALQAPLQLCRREQ